MRPFSIQSNLFTAYVVTELLLIIPFIISIDVVNCAQLKLSNKSIVHIVRIFIACRKQDSILQFNRGCICGWNSALGRGPVPADFILQSRTWTQKSRRYRGKPTPLSPVIPSDAVAVSHTMLNTWPVERGSPGAGTSWLWFCGAGRLVRRRTGQAGPRPQDAASSGTRCLMAPLQPGCGLKLVGNHQLPSLFLILYKKYYFPYVLCCNICLTAM